MNRDADKSECKKYRLEKFLHAQIAQQEKKRQDSTQNKFKSAKEKIQSSFSNTHICPMRLLSSSQCLIEFMDPFQITSSINAIPINFIYSLRRLCM